MSRLLSQHDWHRAGASQLQAVGPGGSGEHEEMQGAVWAGGKAGSETEGGVGAWVEQEVAASFVEKFRATAMHQDYFLLMPAVRARPLSLLFFVLKSWVLHRWRQMLRECVHGTCVGVGVGVGVSVSLSVCLLSLYFSVDEAREAIA